MKKIILVLATIAITLGAYAQADSSIRKMSPPDLDNQENQNINMQNNSDGVVMRNGKMMIVKKGQMTNLNNDMTMSNGTKVMRDGSYIKKDGTKFMMKEGEQIDMSGNMIPMKTNKDKNMDVTPDNTKKKRNN